jgi:hypothetical protein
MDLDPKFRWFKVKLGGPDQQPKEYFFRSMTVNEQRNATAKKDPLKQEEYILLQCVQPKCDWSVELLGTSKKLVEEISRISGLLEGKNPPFDEAVEWMNSVDGKIEAVAISMVAGLNLDILHNCDRYDYAKWLLTGKFMYESIFGRSIAELVEPAPEQPANANPFKENRTVTPISPDGRRMVETTSFEWKVSRKKPKKPE